jgi:hypothetical protein
VLAERAALRDANVKRRRRKPANDNTKQAACAA